PREIALHIGDLLALNRRIEALPLGQGVAIQEGLDPRRGLGPTFWIELQTEDLAHAFVGPCQLCLSLCDLPLRQDFEGDFATCSGGHAVSEDLVDVLTILLAITNADIDLPGRIREPRQRSATDRISYQVGYRARFDAVPLRKTAVDAQAELIARLH